MLNRKETHKITSILLIQNRFPFTVTVTFHFRSGSAVYGPVEGKVTNAINNIPDCIPFY